MDLRDVRSFLYLIAPDLGSGPGPQVNANLSRFKEYAPDLLILGNVSPLSQKVEKQQFGALANSLVVGYIDIAESTTVTTARLTTGNIPNYFGALNPGFEGLYTVQYWRPEWRSLIFQLIDEHIAAGYDGIFLDVLSGANQWGVGNPFNNPVNPNALRDMAELVNSITSYIQSKTIDRPFYVIGNNPTEVAISFPQTIRNLDAVFNESLYWTHSFTDGKKQTALPGGELNLEFNLRLYDGMIVFGNDYPPLNDRNAILTTFLSYAERGIVAGVQNPEQSPRILSEGPFFTTAVASNPVAVGAPNATNYISGGSVQDVTLVGGNREDIVLGGPGSNRITTGSGNDLIFAHPESAGKLGALEIQASGIKVNGVNPLITIKANGNILIQDLSINADRRTNEQKSVSIQFDPKLHISSLEIIHQNDLYVDSYNDRNLYINSLSINGQPVKLTSATYVRDYSLPPLEGWGGDMVWGGRLVFDRADLPSPPNLSVSRSSLVDGGAGLDTVAYWANRADYDIKLLPEAVSLLLRERPLKVRTRFRMSSVSSSKTAFWHSIQMVRLVRHSASIRRRLTARRTKMASVSGLNRWIKERRWPTLLKGS